MSLIEVNPSAISNAIIACYNIDVIELSDVEDLIPKKIVMKFELVEDEKTKKVVEELRKGSGG